MAVNLKANSDGTTGAIQVNGADAVVFGATGITAGALPTGGTTGQVLVSQGASPPIWSTPILSSVQGFSYFLANG